MTIALLLSFLVSFLPSSTMGSLTNEQVELIHYAYTKSIEEEVNPTKIIKLVNCESQWNTEAFNFETESKKKGITKFSSCGLFQHNDKRCADKNSELYDGFYSIDLGFEKLDKQGASAWKFCSKRV